MSNFSETDMGFYLRKSIRVGPLRFNLSNSGVGVSAGVRGFRVGTGPRGNYVQMGVNGIYYRCALPPTTQHNRREPAGPRGSDPALQGSDPVIPPGTHEQLQEIESAAASTIVDSSSEELLREIDQKNRKARIWPWVASIILVACLGAALSPWRAWLLPSLVLIGAACIWAARRRDLLAKTVVLFYEMDPSMEKAYSSFHDSASQLANCARAWHIEAQGRVYDRKYHAGANQIVRRNPTFIRRAKPPYLETNIETIAIGVGKQVLHFFPDRVLVFDGRGVGAVGYRDLDVSVARTRFIEDGVVPSDAQIVDHTWRYVNKNGGPDRRFRDNRQLPICAYDEISLRSSTGLDEVVQVSRCSVGEGFASAVRWLAAKLPTDRSMKDRLLVTCTAGVVILFAFACDGKKPEDGGGALSGQSASSPERPGEGSVAQPAASEADSLAPLTEDVSLDLSIDILPENRVVLRGATNLPDGTYLMASVTNRLEEFAAQDKVIVGDGIYEAGPFGPASGLAGVERGDLGVVVRAEGGFQIGNDEQVAEQEEIRRQARDEARAISSELTSLVRAGRDMDRLRDRDDLARLRSCGQEMRKNQTRAETLRHRSEELPKSLGLYLAIAATYMNRCVSCLDDATDSCDWAEESLSDAREAIEHDSTKPGR